MRIDNARQLTGARRFIVLQHTCPTKIVTSFPRIGCVTAPSILNLCRILKVSLK
jgi:hypothetical protein